MKQNSDGELECERFLKSKGITRNLTKDPWDTREYSKWFDSLNETTIRGRFIESFGFAILSKEGIEAMRPYAPLLEIGAGSGYWSYEIQRHGIDIIATDSFTGKYAWFCNGTDENGMIPCRRWDKLYTEVIRLNCFDAIKLFPRRNILTVWPDYSEPWAANAISMFTGKTVIYMGEGMGNATADDRFHEILDEEFSDQVYVRMPHFWGSYDRRLLICSRPKQLTNRKEQNNDK